METNQIKNVLLPHRIRRVFLFTLFFSALTGLAQMPIFKRYYIANIPGLGWLGEFFITYRLHYTSAIIFIALVSYIMADHLLSNRKNMEVTISGYIRGTILFLILATGILLVFRNLPGYRFSPAVVVALDFSHLGLVILYMFIALFAFISHREWVLERKAAE